MSDDQVGQVPTGADVEPGNGLDTLTDEVLPALIARLRASRLGELEVRSDGWRVRLRRDLDASRARTAGAAAEAAGSPAGVTAGVARSPAVGYFDPGPAVTLGGPVQSGDLLGSIDVLGIVQDVNAPCDGIISAVLVDDGQAVEYGQALIEIDPLELEDESPASAAAGEAG